MGDWLGSVIFQDNFVSVQKLLVHVDLQEKANFWIVLSVLFCFVLFCFVDSKAPNYD